MKIRSSAALAAAVVLVALACQKEKKVAAASMVAPAAAPAAIPTDDEALRFAQTYIDAIYKPNVPKAAVMIDWELLLERATAGEGINDEWRRGFIRGAARQGHTFVGNIVKAIEDGGTLKLLRVRTTNGEKRVVLRLLMPESGVNYHEMLLARGSDGVVRARDVYIYASGEHMSETMNRLYLMAAASNPSLLARLSGKKHPFVQSAQDYRTMMEKVRDGDPHGAIAIYRRLPESLRRDKAVMVGYVVASGSIDDDAAYAKAMDELRAAHPHERGLDLMFIDSHLIARRYAEALRAIDNVDRAVGGDPYMDVLRANVYTDQGDQANALAYAQRALEKEPELEQAWWALVSMAVERKDHAETARLLTHIRDELGVELADLTTIPDYAEFVRSDAYARFAQ